MLIILSSQPGVHTLSLPKCLVLLCETMADEPGAYTMPQFHCVHLGLQASGYAWAQFYLHKIAATWSMSNGPPSHWIWATQKWRWKDCNIATGLWRTLIRSCCYLYPLCFVGASLCRNILGPVHGAAGSWTYSSNNWAWRVQNQAPSQHRASPGNKGRTSRGRCWPHAVLNPHS